MGRFKILIPGALLLAGIELLAGGCGSGTQRVLQSISVTPAAADAQNFTNGQVQFSVMGNYNLAPMQASVTAANWMLSDNTLATITQSGLAQCNSGQTGVVTVTAGVPMPCSGTGCAAGEFRASAQLTCP